VEGGKPRSSFDARKISSAFIIADFVHGFSGRRGGAYVRCLRWVFVDFPVGLVKRFEEVFEKILKQRDASGEFHIYMTVVLENQPRDVGYNELIFRIAPPMIKVSYRV
jgi:hypothetical protein